ncbi:penicillin-binding protein 2 [uncultured Traorella sp.]|uniref:peptidoglycan D,D-transpeptidase FtsI family protein n=1 Tax=uncultured Traorella sp. TaxID=1929048 RepID=UPI0025CEF7DE|nr:penicillin-binding protein 2 [uncultured Traorella sp.]
MLRNPFKELDARMRKRSSDLLRSNMDFNKVVNKRARILILSVFACFFVIAVRLIQIQYFSQDEYIVKLAAFTQKNQISSPPRGDMIDRNGNVLVSSEEIVNITYYPQKDLSSYSESKWQLAYKFAVQFDIQSDSITEREWKDYYIMVAKDRGASLLSDDQKKLSDSEQYSIKISKITSEMIEELRNAAQDEADANRGYLTNEQKYIAWPVMYKMEQATLISSAVVVENASEENTAYLIEHKEEFVGFDISTDSQRVYPYGSVLRDVFGRVSTTGLEEGSKDYYLANDYALNDRFGTSGLEKEYENYLSGTKTIKQITYDEDTGSPIFTTIQEGKKGYNIQLTIDIDLQQRVDAILQKYLTNARSNVYRKDFKQAFLVMMNPQNGEILAMSGQQIQDDGSFIPFASGNYLQSFLPGSSVKPAVLYMGLNEGAVQPGEVINDTTMYFAGGLVKGSYNNKGLINDIEAIRQSSNVYMFHIAIRLGGGYYTPYGALNLPNVENAYELYRKYFSMFGLGTETQLDVPYEESGYPGTDDTSGHLLDFSIGQYESYTPIQLLQYVSTVGTGVKVRPHFMKQIYEINDDETIVEQFGTQVIDVLNGNEAYLERVKEGMRQCISSGACGAGFASLNKDIAAKTGTAEVGTVSDDTSNSIMIGFAPSENPTIAFACVAPTSSTGNLESNVCMSIVYDALVEYYKTYE